MAYSGVADLLLGDLTLSAGYDKERWIKLADEEIDAKLGWVYALPISPIPPLVALPTHETLLLKQISSKLASGRLIMAQSIGGEDQRLQAYGYSLVKEAMEMLLLIANGDIVLSAPKTEDVEQIPDKRPAIYHHDSESLFSAFENNVMRPDVSGQRPWYSRPGIVP